MSRQLKYYNGELLEYEILKLVDSYDPILRKPTTPVDFDVMENKEISFYAMSLIETLGSLEGLGLSANQVGLPWRMFALNTSDKLWILINPKIVERSVGKSKFKEGCLSFPGLFLDIGRSSSVTVEFQSVGGQVITQTFDGLTATCVQHEMDHLDGIVYTDLVSPIKLQKAKEKARLHARKVKRWAKQQAIINS